VTPSFSRAALVIAALHAVLGLLVFEPALFPGGDNAGYLILGEALRTGEGYRDLYLPGSPLHAKYPPVFPSILAILGWLGGVQLFKVAMLAFTTATVWLTARLGRELIGPGAALIAAGLLAVNPTLLEYGHYILSEAPFVFFVMLCLWAARRDDRLWTAVAVGAAVLAFGTRTAGLALMLALPLAWGLQRQFRRSAAAAIAAVSAMTLWAVYQTRADPMQASYLEELLLVDPYNPAAGSVSLAGLVARAAGNLWAYASRVVPQALFGTEGLVSGLAMLLGLAIALCGLLGWAKRARRGLGVPEAFLLLYGGLIAIWPVVWTDRRFLLPVVPVLILFATGVLADLPTRIPAVLRRYAPVALAAIVAIPALVWTFERGPERVDCVARYQSGSACDPAPQASLYRAAEWARENTPPDAIIVNRKPRLFWWYSRRQGDLYPYSADPATVMRAIDDMGASYVVVDQVSGTTARYLVPAIRAVQTRFELVYEGGSPSTYLFRLTPPGGNAE
jgi:hypothetical protein